MELYINDRFRDRKVDFFNAFTFNLVYNSIASTFGFKFYFDPKNQEHIELACVTHFHEVTVKHNNETLLTGVMVPQSFSQSSKKELASFGGYSKTGILEDCQIPPSAYPLQYDGLTLANIAQRMISPFKKNYNLEMAIDPSVSGKMNKSIPTATSGETQTIKDFLSSLAVDKDIIITHDELGRLLFTEAKTESDPILDFDLTKGSIPGTTFKLEYDGQGMHSHITVLKDANDEGGNAGEYTIRNPYVVGSVYRPRVSNQTSGDDIDTSDAARKMLGDELRGVRLTITTDRWVVDDKILKPNNIITIKAPELYIFRKERFFIESINYTGDEKGTTATLNCVLPEVYNKKTPVNIFREINLHDIHEDE